MRRQYPFIFGCVSTSACFRRSNSSTLNSSSSPRCCSLVTSGASPSAVPNDLGTCFFEFAVPSNFSLFDPRGIGGLVPSARITSHAFLRCKFWQLPHCPHRLGRLSSGSDAMSSRNSSGTPLIEWTILPLMSTPDAARRVLDEPVFFRFFADGFFLSSEGDEDDGNGEGDGEGVGDREDERGARSSAPSAAVAPAWAARAARPAVVVLPAVSLATTSRRRALTTFVAFSKSRSTLQSPSSSCSCPSSSSRRFFCACLGSREFVLLPFVRSAGLGRPL